MNIEPRKPGRPPRGAPPAPPRPPTATQRLAELEAMRQANGGLIVSMPDAMHGASIMLPNESLGGDGLHVSNRAMKEAEKYFAALSEIGTPADMDLAWTMWKTALGIANPKGPFEARFNALKDAAGRRHEVLWQASQREAERHRHHIEHRDRAADLRRQLVAAEREVARIVGLIDRHESMRPAA
jgi:hypothetical protein